MITVTKKKHQTVQPYPLLTGKERRAIWERLRGMWKHRKPDPINELQRMRRESSRPLPPFR